MLNVKKFCRKNYLLQNFLKVCSQSVHLQQVHRDLLGKKASYDASVAKVFVGDHLRLENNLKWNKMTSNDNIKIRFADDGFKIHRSSGKVFKLQISFEIFH